MNIAVCDDILDEMESIISSVKQYFADMGVVVDKYIEGTLLVERHKSVRYDLIFLDVMMPLFNGMDTAGLIRQFDTETPIIFITYSEEFAIKGYSVMAFDYIIKPVSSQEINSCLDRYMATKKNERFINIVYKGVDTRLPLNKIQYLESSLHKVLVHIKDEKIIDVSGKLDDYEKELGNGFIRCHKSFLVNADYVKKIEGNTFVLSHGGIVRISRTYKNPSKQAYYTYLFQ